MKIFAQNELAFDEKLPGNRSFSFVCWSRLESRQTFDEVFDKPCSQQAEEELGELDCVEHPNLVKMHRLVHLPDSADVVVQRVRKQRLSERLYQLQSPPMNLRLDWIRALIAAMTALHEKHIVHGNLTPENVLFDEAQPDVPTITDYGMTRFYERHVPGWTLNERYTAPEVVSSDLCSVESDVFSLGIVIWQILTLQRLPDGSLPNLTAIGDTEKRAIIARCLHYRPWDRPELREIEAAFAKKCYCE
ncbi:tyrosine-protein kinase receptor Tie-1-like [Tropilaelaps mercedesae]|uniref:Tyrosine-protein kinase receptor Tie-1-like n=1 Tax=Tropilaelaps mercedesae TaxID=418985 RepID=A0A1V9X307_9ACAR|nr:tyrosine-protein kinase receptor Tie-1-like [Tropilaelaps mercedesae]